MKKMKKIVFGLTGFFLALPVLCLGATDWYDSVNTGVTFVSNSDIKYNELGFSGSQKFEYGAGYSVGVAFGNITEPIRFEGEVSYRHNEFESVDGISIPSGYSIETSQQNFLFNGYFDFNSGSSFTPYLTAGAGFSRVEADINLMPISDEFDDTLFAYQIGAGVGYVISEIMTFDFRYRFLSAADPEFSYPGGTVEAEIFSHKLTIGVHMAF
jgi:opacity protein-like surface antigen